jgi:sec-independent protein translocase protein TatA
MFGALEVIVIIVAILVLFGGAKLPALSKGIGRMVKNIRYGIRGDDDIQVHPSTKASEDNDSHHQTE